MENKQNSSLKNEVQSLETLVQHDESGMFTTSLIIAEAFGKDHKNVLQAIENLECSPEFHRLNFQLSSYTAQTGNGTVREYPAYQLTRDGFAFLAMGFTGKKAAAWKEKFLAAFNAMECALTKKAEIKDDSTEPLRDYPCLEDLGIGPCTDEQIMALEDMIVFWCYVEGCSHDYALKTLLSALRLPSLKHLQQEYFVEAVNMVWRFTFQLTDFTNVAKNDGDYNAFKSLIRMSGFLCGEHPESFENYVCRSCQANSIENVAPKDMRKLFFAAFRGLIGNFPGRSTKKIAKGSEENA